MKGLLSGMSIPSLFSKSPKRHRKLSSGGSRKKSRKSSGLSTKSHGHTVNTFPEETPDTNEAQLEEPVLLEPEGKETVSTEVEENSGPLQELVALEPDLTPRSITYEGGTATVRLNLKQTVAMDGWAMVSLLQGRASVHGYSLIPGVAVLLCSNSKLAAAVNIESQYVDGAMSSVQSGGFSKKIDPSVTGCILVFKSYRGVDVVSPMVVDDCDPESAAKRTFKLEIPGETVVRDVYAEHLIQKRKREELAGKSFQADESKDGEDGDDGGKDSEMFEDQVDMEVDEQADDSEGFSDDHYRRKAQKVAQTPLQPTVIPQSWGTAANAISSYSELSSGAPLVAVCGAKSSGKSTFGRFLLNHLLNSYESVGYLDTDVGQPEFTVPGCLSLHILRKPVFGSPILHLQNPERSFFYGDNSPKSDPEMYCRSIEALYDYFQQNYGVKKTARSSNDDKSGIPLIINTHGWLKGVGYDVLVNILRHTSPTHLVHINSNGGNNNLPTGQFWESSSGTNSTVMLYIENALEGPDKPLIRVKAPADQLRDARILAYFRQCFWRSPLPYPYREDRLYAQTAMKLVSCPPFQIPISAVKIIHLHCQVPQNEKLYSINGALVGLGVSMRTEKKYPGGPPAACVGVGIVRGVDPDKGILYLITPLDVETLQGVDTLLQGWMEVPLPLLQASGYASPYLSHNSVAIEGTGSVAIKKAYEKFAKSPKRT
ncbi:hypothetical protein Mapa_004679 [Marchantia paleacea]|nr:hypothetical protein Mapa_004679 [Marchantia paleacea]